MENAEDHKDFQPSYLVPYNTPTPVTIGIGKKFDTGKTKVAMMIGYFARAIEAVGKAATYGNNKYADGYWDHNWDKLDNAKERYADALMRHLLEYLKGNRIDPESGLTHISKVAWNALALTELEARDGQNTIS